MVCVYCGSKLAVDNSRHQRKTNSVWRRRSCSSCGAVLTSVEAIDYGSVFTFARSKTHLEPFSRIKLYISVYESCKHRKHPETDAMALTDTAISQVATRTTSTVINRSDLVAGVASVLKRFDSTASVQYLAFHPIKK